MQNSIANLFAPVRVGRHTLKNRIVMGPMTRSRADHDGVPTPIVAEHYAQRARAGLIITEGVYPSPVGKGYVRTPGIHSQAQVDAWRQVADAIHRAGSLIFMQIMHTGRVSHPSLLPGEALPVAPSAVRAEGRIWTNDDTQKVMVQPRALALEEIPQIIAEYRDATEKALAAGFDGVELHGASGYLPEQFLSSATNRRSDAYGGDIRNRARFVLEVIEAMVQVAGNDRVGIKIAPELGLNGVSDDSPWETYSCLVRKLDELNLAYLHIGYFGAKTDYRKQLRPLFRGPILIGGGLKKSSAESLIQDGTADAAVFALPFIANPDLPDRLQKGLPLSVPDKSTFYTPGPKGYTDYPAASDH
jgi:N-ethylmaleimide reductase